LQNSITGGHKLMLKRLAVIGLLAALLAYPAAALETKDLLALVAMPLAVAAVSEMADVPQDQLIDVVSLLNDAAVPPTQFVEVVRYVPVALVTPVEGPTFVEFVRTQEQTGIRGTQLVTVIEDRYRTIGVPVDLDVVAPRVVEFDHDTFFPPIVRTRMEEVRMHPHGGPPGQLKKIVGVQTGAEIVHGEHPGKGKHKERTVVIAEPRRHVERETIRVKPERDESHGPPMVMKPGHGNDKGHGGNPHGGNPGGGKGKGKGKG
jgi:hypothetical protein